MAHNSASPEPHSERFARYRAAGLWNNRTLADGLEAGAIRRPEATAVADNDESLTYAQLALAVAAGVLALRDLDVGSDDAFVLVGGNTVAAVVAYHALLRAGTTVLLLDRRCGVADVRHALELLPGPRRVIVAADERKRLLDGVDAQVMALEQFGARSDPTPKTATGRAPRVSSLAWPELKRDAPAVVLFTSGTTSRPKGVVHSLNTLTAGADNMARITGATDQDVLFLVSPLTSIAGIMQTHLAADQHATLVLEDSFDPDRSLDRINTVEATVLGGAPVIAERLLHAAQRRGCRLALRTMALGGAMLPRPLLELATATFGIEIARVYGSSEAPNFSGSTPSDDRVRRLADDGMLMAGNEVRIGSSDHPQEGLLRGPCLFHGYIDAHDNASAFEDGWYRTGDLIEVTDGRVTVVGRLKEVVNRNGLKISLHEIDAALVGLPGAVEHASFAMPDSFTGERLVVAVRPVDGAEVTLADVVRHLLAQGTAQRKLPEEVVIWDGPLPRTASGKVVRSRLVMEAPAQRQAKHEGVATRAKPERRASAASPARAVSERSDARGGLRGRNPCLGVWGSPPGDDD